MVSNMVISYDKFTSLNLEQREAYFGSLTKNQKDSLVEDIFIHELVGTCLVTEEEIFVRNGIPQDFEYEEALDQAGFWCDGCGWFCDLGDESCADGERLCNDCAGELEEDWFER